MKELPTPLSIKEALPLKPSEAAFIAQSRETVEHILIRKDPRKLLIVGPCSIHDVDACLEYAEKLKSLAESASGHFFCIMRAYVEKARSANGWKGLIHDPHLNESCDVTTGISLARIFLLNLAKLRVPAATEFVTPLLAPYIQDLITWGCIGARTSSSQVHRLLASSLPMPVGIKNTVDGNVQCAASGIAVARHPQAFVHLSEEGAFHLLKSQGNPYAHLVLRGSENSSNHSEVEVDRALLLLRQMELPARLLIDCSHGNSKRQYFKQKEVFQSVLAMGQEDQIIGLMLESHLEAGRQKIPNTLSDLQRGVSITDACLDYHSTEEIVLSSVASSLSLSN